MTEIITEQMHDLNKKIYASLGIPSLYDGYTEFGLFTNDLNACAMIEQKFICEYPDGTFQTYIKNLIEIVNQEKGWSHQVDRLVTASPLQKTLAINKTIDDRNIKNL